MLIFNDFGVFMFGFGSVVVVVERKEQTNCGEQGATFERTSVHYCVNVREELKSFLLTPRLPPGSQLSKECDCDSIYLILVIQDLLLVAL